MKWTKFTCVIRALLVLILVLVSHVDPLWASFPGNSSETLSNDQKLSESSLRKIVARGINEKLQEVVEKDSGDLSEEALIERYRKNREPFHLGEGFVNRAKTLSFFSRDHFLERIALDEGIPGKLTTNFRQRTLGPSELIDTTRRFIRSTHQFLEILGKRNASS